MATKATNFFISIVKPTVDEFLHDTGDLRRGFLAAIVLYHTADYWWLENKITYNDLSSLHVALIQRCPDFGVIRDVADTSKHAELDVSRQKKIPRNLLSSDKVNVIKDFFSDGFSIFSYGPSVVKFTLDDKTYWPREGPVRSVLSMWETLL